MLRIANPWPILASAFFFALLLGCNKDAFETQQNLSGSILGESSIAADRNPITKQDARNWFTSQYGDKKHILKQNSGDTLEFDIKPVWAFSTSGIYGTSTPIVMAPVQRIAPFDFGKQGAYFLLFYKDSLANIQARLVVCIGDDTYADGTKPKTLLDFSGLIMKMDLQGVFQNRISVTKCGYNITDALADPNATGIIWAYVDPFENGGGSIGSGDPRTGCYHFENNWFEKQWGKIKGFFGGGSGGDLGGSGVIWVNTHWTPWGALGGTNGHGGVGCGGGGTGTTNTGNALEQYHFTNLYTNPMFQISEYFENMNINSEAYQIFGFLNSDGRQFLANEQGFIDPCYGFLVNQNNSSLARAFISDIIAEMMLKNMTYLSLNDLNSLFNSFQLLDEVLIEPNIQGVPTVNTVIPMCPLMFDFRYSSNAQIQQFTGILNLRMTLPVNGINTDFIFPRILFESGNVGGTCPESLNQKAADAINTAIANTILRITNNTLFGNPPMTLNERIRTTLFVEVDRNFHLEVQQCAPDASGIHTSVKLLGNGQPEEYILLYNTLFRDFSMLFSVLCS
jgi:hypothetical protein